MVLKMGERRKLSAAAKVEADRVRRFATQLDSANKGEVRAVQALVAQLNARIGLLEGKLGEIRGDIQRLDVRVTALEGARGGPA